MFGIVLVGVQTRILLWPRLCHQSGSSPFHLLEGRRFEGYQLVGRFSVDPNSGAAVLTVLVEELRVRLQAMAGGLLSRTLGIPVRPEDGELYLRTLQETFVNSSYWRMVAV